VQRSSLVLWRPVSVQLRHKLSSVFRVERAKSQYSELAHNCSDETVTAETALTRRPAPALTSSRAPDKISTDFYLKHWLGTLLGIFGITVRFCIAA
jgi:hypothetical protein